MNRQETIEVLSQIQYNIEATERKFNQRIEDNPYYLIFGSVKEWNHTKEISRKALLFWKRKFNRILLTIKY